MLVIAGTLRFDPVAQERLAEATADITTATRAESDCIEYRFAIDGVEPGSVHVFEHWASEDAWRAHMATPHVATFVSAIAGIVKDSSIRRYDVSDSGPLVLEG